MQKILFDYKNAIDISRDASQICLLYTELTNQSLEKIVLLDALAKVFGYTGWGHLSAVNKSERFYLPFSLAVYSHVKAIKLQLINTLPFEIDCEKFLVAVSLAELRVKSLNELQKIYATSVFESGKFVAWFTKNITLPERHLAQSPQAAIIRREGIYLKDFQKLWPELANYLVQIHKFDSDQVLLFDFSIWWDYYELFKNNFAEEEIGCWEVHLIEKKSKRICYHPISSINNSMLGSIVNTLSEGLPGCISQDDFEHMNDKDFIINSLNYFESQTQVEKIYLSIKKSRIAEFLSADTNFLQQFLISHDEKMDFIRNRLTSSDFTLSMYSFEPRFIFKNKKKIIYEEIWLVDEDIQRFVEVNNLMFNQLKLIEKFDIYLAYNYIKKYTAERLSRIQS